jgi:hypothetical protein
MSPEFDLQDLRNKVESLGSLELRKACTRAGLRAYYFQHGRKKYYPSDELRGKLYVHISAFQHARVKLAEFFAEKGSTGTVPVLRRRPVEGTQSEDFDTSEDNALEVDHDAGKVRVRVDGEPKPGEKQDFARGLEALVRNIAEQVAANTLNEEGVKAIVKESLEGAKEEIQRELIVPTRVTVVRPDKTELPVGLVHKQFKELLQYVSATANGTWVNVWIAGPAGSGKSHAGRQVAQALGRPFYTNGAVDLEHKLLGYQDANGVYRTTPFHEAFSKPAIYMFDEVDRSLVGALLAFDGALANGHCDFPGAPEGIARHEECAIIACGNTFGFGADSQYVGAARMDAAFLDRFVHIKWDYDEALERAVAGNDQIVSDVQTLRAKARAAGLKVVISPRASIYASALVRVGVTHEKALNAAVFQKLPAQDRKALEV